MFRSPRVWLAAIGLAVFLTLPAAADIKAFNEKVSARDFKAAAAEAAATWPTLDKTRKDIAIIAREFGFAAYMAGDYVAARTFAEFAVANEPEGPDAQAQRATAAALVMLAAYKQKPAQATRNELFSAMSARVTMPGFDIISFLGVDALVAYDLEKGNWQDAQASSTLAEQLTLAGGLAYKLNNRKFQLYNAVADYMVTKDKPVYDRLDALSETMRDDIDAAATEEEAAKFADFYWSVHAWKQAIGTHLVGRFKMKWPDKDDEEEGHSERVARLLDGRTDSKTCKLRIDMKKKPSYPASALYGGMIGVVILQVDIDGQGMASNAEVLTAVPEKYFGDAVLKSVKDIRYVPGEPWNTSCSLATKARVITFSFAIAR
jgi:TonB family protein